MRSRKLGLDVNAMLGFSMILMRLLRPVPWKRGRIVGGLKS